jgi:pimeloyl-ACP methyl ester carboxylesterase
VEDVYYLREGQRVHCQVAGSLDAPPLVLVHGIGGNINWWRRNLTELAQYFRVYALDLPGFGHSWRLRDGYTIDKAAEFLHDWLIFMGLEQVHLLGHSMGGQISLRLAVRYPEQLHKLILLAPSGLWLPVREHVRWMRQMPKVKVPLEQTLTIAFGTLRTDMLALLFSLQAIITDPDVVTTLQNLHTPSLFLWGTADVVVPPALASTALQHVPAGVAQLRYIENGTHDAMCDQSEIFNRLVLEFLQA